MSADSRARVAGEPPSSSAASDDAAFLDEFFDAATASAQRGEELELRTWTQARPHLEPDLRRLLESARSAIAPVSGARQRIHGYTVIRELGRGAMGCVYLAEQSSVGGRAVALKVLPAAVALSETARARFLLETRSLARIQHPNVVTIHDVIAESDVLAYAMEWIDGPTFAGLIEQMRPPNGAGRASDASSRDRLRAALGSQSGASSWVQLVSRVGVAIARALQAVHEAGLVHRDVKPSNILLRKDGTALLSDFGLVRSDDSSMHTLTGDMVGTLGYAAPELLRGQHDAVTAASDVFGLGATLYHALCFELPFGRASAVDVLRRIESGAWIAPRKRERTLPRDLDTILVKALDADPKRRYASAAELADDLQRLLDLRPIQARRASVLERAWKRVRRNSRSFAAGSLGIALGLAAAGAVGWQVWERSQRPARIERLVQQARMRLVTHSGANFAFYSVAHPRVRDVSGHTLGNIDHAATYAALELYDDAVALGCDDPRVLTERDALELVCQMSVGAGDDASSVPDRLRARCPITAAVVQDWQRYAENWPSLRSVLETASELDLRALGLIAYLAGVHAICVESLSSIETLESFDPLVQAFLGELRLQSGRPELAFPLLLRARDACPDAPRIATSLASAAILCGDATTAARVLGELKESDFEPKDSTLLRVRADLDWLRGDLDAARAGYEGAATLEDNPIAHLRLAQMHELAGDLEAAWKSYLHLGVAYSAWREVLGGFRRSLEAWWRSLDDSQRLALLAHEIREPPPGDARSFPWHPGGSSDEQTRAARAIVEVAKLRVSLLALRRCPPTDAPRDRGAAPWLALEAVPLANAPALNERVELGQLHMLAAVFDCDGESWAAIPRSLRAVLVRGGFEWDCAMAASPAHDRPVVREFSRAAGIAIRVLTVQLARVLGPSRR